MASTTRPSSSSRVEAGSYIATKAWNEDDSASQGRGLVSLPQFHYRPKVEKLDH